MGRGQHQRQGAAPRLTHIQCAIAGPIAHDRPFHGREQDRAYPQLLQQQLDHGPQAGRYRVINAGSRLHELFHGRLYLKEHGLALKPAVVIAGYGSNDIVLSGDVQASLRVATAHHAAAPAR